MLWPSLLIASDLHDAVLDSAENYLYVREKTGHNDAPEIDAWLAYLGLGPKQAYCAAFAVSMYKEGAEFVRISQPLPKLGRVSLLWKTCQKNPYRYKTFSSKRVFLGVEELQKADLPVWSSGKVAGNSNWNGHTGLVVGQVDRDTFSTIEANTGAGNTGSQRDGNGVFKRTRNLDIGKKFMVEGFIRVK